MQDNGWSINVTHDNPANFNQQCSNATWFGFKWGPWVGTVSAVFHGLGDATLSFGNCGKSANGLILVSLNNNQIGSAVANTPKKEITFEYSAGDILLIREGGNGIAIIALNSLNVFPKGKK